MLNPVPRLTACVLALSLVAPDVIAVPRLANRPMRCALGTGARFASVALAPVAAGMIHSIDQVRQTLIHVDPVLGRRGIGSLPRYTGAGETSIHKAIYDFERLFKEGKREEALALMDELLIS